MKLGTIVHNNEIYNLDYMTAEEVTNLLNKIENTKNENITQIKNIMKIK